MEIDQSATVIATIRSVFVFSGLSVIFSGVITMPPALQAQFVNLVGVDLRNQRPAFAKARHGDVLAGKGSRIIRIARAVGKFVTGRNRTVHLVDDMGDPDRRHTPGKA